MTTSDITTSETSSGESPVTTRPSESVVNIVSAPITVSPVAEMMPDGQVAFMPTASTEPRLVPEGQPSDTAPARATPADRGARPGAPSSILAIDIGGTKVKILASGQTEPRKAPSGKGFTPAKLVEVVRALTHDWKYEAVSIGYPGLVGPNGPRSEPGNLGSGWVGFDFAAAFDKPVKMVNDATMQALGSYEGGRMLFLGLGTGLGSSLIAGHVVIPLELGQLPFDDERTFGEVLGRQGLERLGKSDWRRAVNRVVTSLMRAFVADYVVIGGGKSKLVKDLPHGVRLGHNLTAFRGGFRLWSVEDVWVLAASGGDSIQPTMKEALRIL